MGRDLRRQLEGRGGAGEGRQEGGRGAGGERVRCRGGLRGESERDAGGSVCWTATGAGQLGLPLAEDAPPVIGCQNSDVAGQAGIPCLHPLSHPSLSQL